MSKDQFYEVRESGLTSPEKRIHEYLKQQNADRKQLEHIRGNKQTWK